MNASRVDYASSVFCNIVEDILKNDDRAEVGEADFGDVFRGEFR